MDNKNLLTKQTNKVYNAHLKYRKYFTNGTIEEFQKFFSDHLDKGYRKSYLKKIQMTICDDFRKNIPGWIDPFKGIPYNQRLLHKLYTSKLRSGSDNIRKARDLSNKPQVIKSIVENSSSRLSEYTFDGIINLGSRHERREMWNRCQYDLLVLLYHWSGARKIEMHLIDRNKFDNAIRHQRFNLISKNEDTTIYIPQQVTQYLVSYKNLRDQLENADASLTNPPERMFNITKDLV